MSFNVESASTKFKREGSSTNDIKYSLPSALSDLVNKNANLTTTSPDLLNKQTTVFNDLMNRATDQSTVPGKSTFDSATGLNPTSYTGLSDMTTVLQRSPFSAKYENDTKASYEQRAKDALALVASGPDAVRGGAARTGIAQGVMADRLAQGRGQEVRNAQMQDAGLVLNAGQLMNAVENARRGTQLQGATALLGGSLQQQQNALGAASGFEGSKSGNMGMLRLAADLLAPRTSSVLDNLKGEGNQSTIGGGFNICCFIFLEALNGELPWFIELARRDYYTPVRRKGYKWMSNWLVPAMQRRKWVCHVVNAVIIKPFLRYGAWLYTAVDHPGYKFGWFYAPYCKAWLGLWNFLGKVVRKEVD